MSPIGYDNCLLTATIGLANFQLLIGNNNEAFSHYITLGIDTSQLSKAIYKISCQFLEQEDVGLTISCYEVLNKLMLTTRLIKHNIACMYHILALQEKSRNNFEKFLLAINRARQAFEAAINDSIIEPIRASLYMEYSQFLIQHHEVNDIKEYEKIIGLLTKGISCGDDKSMLSYSQLEKPTTVHPVQNLSSGQKEIKVKPYLLAFYLKVKLHNMYNEKDKAQETLERFQAIVLSLKEASDEQLAKHLLNYSCKELESYNPQHKLASLLEDIFKPCLGHVKSLEEHKSLLPMSFALNKPVCLILNYIGKEIRIRYQLENAFNDRLRSSVEVLQIALNNNQIHTDVIFDYLEREQEDKYRRAVMVSRINAEGASQVM